MMIEIALLAFGSSLTGAFFGTWIGLRLNNWLERRRVGREIQRELNGLLHERRGH
jgi:hypothetical protein